MNEDFVTVKRQGHLDTSIQVALYYLACRLFLVPDCSILFSNTCTVLIILLPLCIIFGRFLLSFLRLIKQGKSKRDFMEIHYPGWIVTIPEINKTFKIKLKKCGYPLLKPSHLPLGGIKTHPTYSMPFSKALSGFPK